MLADIKPLIKSATRQTTPDTPEEIGHLESRYGPLPDSYKKLLLTHGPFRFNGSARLVGGAIDDLIVSICYGAGSKHTIYSLESGMEDVFGDRWVPFARDGFGSIYGMDRAAGSIWFFDVEAGFTPTQVFPSMQAFLDAIVVEPD